MGDVQFWHLILLSIGLVGGWLKSYSNLREKVIRLEEKVNTQSQELVRLEHIHNQDMARLEKGIEKIVETTGKIWDRLERKQDK